MNYRFPGTDDIPALADSYFNNSNRFMPLLHRPTFDAHVASGLHLRDPGFASVFLLVCAIGARWLDNPRFWLEGETSPGSAGWYWFNQVQMTRTSLWAAPRLEDVQSFAVCEAFLCVHAFGSSEKYFSLQQYSFLDRHHPRHVGLSPALASELRRMLVLIVNGGFRWCPNMRRSYGSELSGDFYPFFLFERINHVPGYFLCAIERCRTSLAAQQPCMMKSTRNPAYCLQNMINKVLALTLTSLRIVMMSIGTLSILRTCSSSRQIHRHHSHSSSYLSSFNAYWAIQCALWSAPFGCSQHYCSRYVNIVLHQSSQNKLGHRGPRAGATHRS